jgi:hypothetical protein
MLSSSPATSPMDATFKVFERLVRKRGRECTRCGGRHRDPLHKYCEPCRDLTAAWHKAYRHDHIARKLCSECVQKKGRQTIKCELHRKYHNDFYRQKNAEQRAKGLCTWGGACQNPSDGWYCDEHRAKQAEYGRRRAARLSRRRWAA